MLPRSLQHWRIVRSRPPAAPRNLARLPEHRTLTRDDDPQAVLDDAAQWLRSQRWRVDTEAYADGGKGSVAAEKGYARETGNLVFHLALLVLLAAVGLGSVGGFRGTVIVREGSSFANTRAQFDSFNPGKAFSDESMPPFSLTLDDFTAAYQRGGEQDGAAREFTADVTVVREPGAEPEQTRLEVNSPLEVDGVKVFLVGHGYAPTITVKDKDGQVVFRDSVVFLPQDGNFTSTGVVKVPDTTPAARPAGLLPADRGRRRDPRAALDLPRGRRPRGVPLALEGRPRPRPGHAAVGLQARHHGHAAHRHRGAAPRPDVDAARRARHRRPSTATSSGRRSPSRATPARSWR